MKIKADVNARVSLADDGMTVLHYAAKAGHNNVIKILLDTGEIDINIQEENTSLHWAAYSGSVDICEMFLNGGCVHWMLQMNMEIDHFKFLKIIDVSIGRENIPIPVYNGTDDEPLPTDYQYVTANVETADLHINRTISSLQTYHLVPEFNMSEPPLIFEYNVGCRCWSTCNNQVVQNGNYIKVEYSMARIRSTTNLRSRRKEYNKKWISYKRKRPDDTCTTLKQNSIDHIDTCSSESDTDFSYTEAVKLLNTTDNTSLEENHLLSCMDGTHAVPCSTAEVSESNSVIDSSDINRNEWDVLDRLEIMQPVTSESETDEDDLFSIVEELKVWANKFEIKQNALDDLLKILRVKGFEDVLPTCARTLLKTPRTVVMNTVSDMHYYHFGLKYMLEHSLQSVSKEKLEGIQCLVLSLNIDELPLFKSSNTSVWPVLCSISNIKRSHVFQISFSVGTHKPSNLDFFNDVVTDLGELFTSGIVFDGKHFQISISCIICDAPAKALVKNTKLYCGYYGCDKCMQRGDESFRSQSQEEHHKGLSPVTQLPVDMIKQFPIDYMHQVCLGVVKRLILLWMRGPRADFRLSAVLVGQISENLISMRKFIPKEFVRKPRSLIEIDRWKATEFRQFLLYTGAFVLKDVLEPIYYRHFLALSIAVSILFSEKLTAEHSDYAQDLLEWFVERGRELIIWQRVPCI
ncbi:unnamed protein product [Mytilus coruscus]|uniref:Uncharacterized protein n=1 Tax=Mytilus coruscus TaxID=42192 RepID=A0A6J8E275_MYTCO|nr:unnamed protein product [Mytilus coruscus]